MLFIELAAASVSATEDRKAHKEGGKDGDVKAVLRNGWFGDGDRTNTQGKHNFSLSLMKSSN